MCLQFSPISVVDLPLAYVPLEWGPSGKVALADLIFFYYLSKQYIVKNPGKQRHTLLSIG